MMMLLMMMMMMIIPSRPFHSIKDGGKASAVVLAACEQVREVEQSAGVKKTTQNLPVLLLVSHRFISMLIYLSLIDKLNKNEEEIR
jgi:hypothetical protein